MRVDYTAPQPVRDVVGALGRTEDLRLSPDHRRLAVASFLRDRVTLFGVDLATSDDGPRVSLTSAIELSSPAFHRPHGLDFIDDETLIVANREGDVAIFRLPPDAPGVQSLEVVPTQTWRADELDLTSSPGSVAVSDAAPGRCEILVCNNYVHTVTRHQLDLDAASALTGSEVLLQKWLHIPDGVAVSPDRRWIAISNHEAHAVMVYENDASLDEESDPVAVMRGISYPHGLRFSADGRHLLVADAGSPSVLVYARDASGWQGVHQPHATVQVLDEGLFLRGQVNPEEGGPKGIEIDPAAGVLIVTTELLPLAFFELPALSDAASPGASAYEGESDVARELAVMELEVRAERAEREVTLLRSSLSWRLTAPVRRLRSFTRGGP